jgi:hypothetical protein
MHQQLDPRRPRVGKQVAMVRAGGPEDLNHTGQQPVGAGAHVHRIDSQPDRVDADHRSISRSQAAQAPACDSGQRITIVVGPRESSMWMSGGTGAAARAGICTATKAGSSPAVVALKAIAPWPPTATALTRSPSTTQRLSMLAFKPLASATDAIDTPGCRHARTTWALKSALWRLCVRRPAGSMIEEVSMCPR